MSDAPPEETVALSPSARAFAESLVEQGEYDSLDAAVSGILDAARAQRDADWEPIEAEVARRMALPEDQWVRIDSETHFGDRFRKKHGLDEGDA